ncbi:MAG TPA: hypothetical protein VH280_20485 [Verrucomicrobiae bacterium]|jgi:hypothetical protein|nr:hypothetical protein [Verrucomicrobiae bacterium]
MSVSAAFLETDRMYFRQFRDADAQLLFELVKRTCCTVGSSRNVVL